MMTKLESEMTEQEKLDFEAAVEPEELNFLIRKARVEAYFYANEVQSFKREKSPLLAEIKDASEAIVSNLKYLRRVRFERNNPGFVPVEETP